jgi:iron complex outermembrane receptor protein
MFKGAILSAAMLVFAAMAQAQDQGESQGQQSADSQRITEIVVTAQRREERLQDVPIAVQAMDAATLQAMSITNTQDLGALAPGLVVNRVTSAAIFTLRGIGNQDASVLGDEQATPLYVDGVYLPGSQAAVFQFNNIDRIEVLEGPQGTLFGRNATGGVIQIVTKTPSQTPHVDFDVGYGNYNTTTSNLYATGGLSDHLAADISAHVEDQTEGWGRNLFNGRNAFTDRDAGVRSKWLLTLADTRVTFTADYNREKSDIGSAYYVHPGFEAVNGRVGPPGSFYDVDLNWPSDSTNTVYGGSITVDQDLRWAHLISISAFHRIEADVYLDQDATPLAVSNATLIERERTYTQEFQLASAASSAIKWVAGLYYYNDKSGYHPITLEGSSFAPLTLDINSVQSGVSYAGFGQATATILPATDLTLGVRYTSDHRHVVGQIDTNVPGLILGPGNQAKNFDKTTFRVALDHHFTDDVLAYVSFNRGFKSGVFNSQSPSGPAVEPEVLDATEIGLKTEFLDNRLRLNTAAYYYKFTNMQLREILTGTSVTVNAASAKIKGLDMSVEALPVRNLTLRGGFSYVDSRFSSYPDAPHFVPTPGGGLAETPGDATGNELPYAPKYSFNVGGDYAFPTGHGRYTFNISYSFTDTLFVDADNLFKQSSFGFLNSSLTWAALSGKWDVRLWGKNLNNEHTYTFVQEQSYGVTASPAAPRTFGITFGVHWEP